MSRKIKQNRMVTDELWEQVNPENKELLRDFLDYLRSVGRSPTTIEAYENDARIFFVWCLQNASNKPLYEITKRHIISFQNFLMSTNENGAKRVKRIKSTLSSMCNYIENILDDDFPNFRNIIRKIPDPTEEDPRQTKTVLTDEQVQSILDMLVKNKEYDKAAMFSLSVNSGRRKSELILWKTNYCTPDTMFLGTFYKTPEKIRTKGRGVAGKPLFCYVLARPFNKYLKLWMDERERLGIESEWLFPKAGDYSQHIDIATMNRWIDSISKRTGLELYWHSTRHYWVTSLSRQGIPQKVIKTILGWTDISMCDIYDDTEEDEVLSQYFSDGEIIGKQKSLADL